MRLFDRRYRDFMKRGLKGAVRHIQMRRTGFSKKNLRVRVGFGTMYNLFLESTHQKPNRDVYTLVEAFHNCTFEIDRIIDTKHYREQNKRFTKKELRAITSVRPEMVSFVRKLKTMPLSPARKKEILRCVYQYRKEALRGVERTFENPFAKTSNVLKGIEETGAAFFGATTEIMALAHGMNSGEAHALGNTFRTVGMAFQIRDDFRDCTHDFGIVQNIIVSIAQKHPQEFKRIEALRQQDIPRMWARENLPNTMAEADALLENYASSLPKTPQGKQLALLARDIHYMK